ncbi:MAG: sugar phosphate nucleotidyltransferase [Flavobacteriaceae bacterium]|nr:sugar phosphate nucleotidyltransferase [Flavobacteriaceae bacterium]
MKAFIFAAGMGTRLKPFTLHHPKALVKVGGVPLLERNIKYLQSFGINDFIINIHHFGGQIIDFLKENDNFGANIQISDEREELLETGGALLFAKELLEEEENILVMNADILTTLNIGDFIKFHLNSKNFVSLAVSERESSRKLLFDNEMILNGWRNEKTGEEKLGNTYQNLKPLAFSGIHCINTNLLKIMKRTGKFSIMDEYLDLMKDYKIKGYLHDALFIDVGKPEAITEAEKYFN